MLTLPVTDPRAWRASAIEERPSWYYPLSERCLDETVQTPSRKRLPLDGAAVYAGEKFQQR